MILDDGHGSHNHEQGNTGILGAAFQIANTIMGAGILGLPVAMRYLGIVFGSAFMIINALVTIYSVALLLQCKDITNH